MEQTKTTFTGVLILLLTALIWGSSFVSQQVGMDNVQAFTFMAVRTILGATVLLPVIVVKDKLQNKNLTNKERADKKLRDKKTVFYGIILGLLLCAATNFQQFAFYYSNAGKIAFITAMYMFFVPIAGLFFKKKIPLITWLCIVMGFVGLYFLSFSSNSFSALNKGDILTFICALFFTAQILCIERFAPKCDGIKLSCVQFYTSGIISLILMFIFEQPKLSAIKLAAGPILYSGIMSCGVAYTLQIVGQKRCEATIASLLMCMESVFAVLAAALILGQKLTFREASGCIIMFSAILISQISDIIKKRLNN